MTRLVLDLVRRSENAGITDHWLRTHVPFAAERTERTDDVGRLARDVMRLAVEVTNLQGRNFMDVIDPNQKAEVRRLKRELAEVQANPRPAAEHEGETFEGEDPKWSPQNPWKRAAEQLKERVNEQEMLLDGRRKEMRRLRQESGYYRSEVYRLRQRIRELAEVAGPHGSGPDGR